MDIMAKREGQIELKDEEKLTLFRNSVKFVLSYDLKGAAEGQTLQELS